MLRKQNNIPLDYSMCCMTVTVYHREGLTRHVIGNAHYEYTREEAVSQGIREAQRQFLLVVPGHCPLQPGDKVVPGEGPEITAWSQLNLADVPGLGVIRSVKPRYFRGRLCHTEARG